MPVRVTTAGVPDAGRITVPFTQAGQEALRFLLILCWGFSSLATAQQPVGSGPFPAAILPESSLPTHTIYRPADLSSLEGEKLPIVAWGNGACTNSNYAYREFLAEIASHGFLVVAVGPYRDTPAPRPERTGPPAEWPPFETSTGRLIDGINWAITEGKRGGSPYRDRIDAGKIAVMGHSCGGIQAIEASYDRRITTTLVLNSGLLDANDPYMQRFGVDRSVLEQLHAPIAYFIGGESDIAYANAEQDWSHIRVMSVKANLPVGHGATYGEKYGGAFVAAPLAWLRWRLQGTKEAAAMFRGEDCGFCTGSGWRLETRGLE